jgi:hypothetical protein
VSLLVVTPELLTSAATDLDGIHSTLNAAYLAAAVPTTGLAAAAADEVSEAVAALFARYGKEFQALSARASAVGQQFAQALNSAAGSYATGEARSVSLLRQVQNDVLGAVNVPGGTGAVGTAINDLDLLVARELSIYDFRTWRGWAAFLLDYTWGLPGTMLGYGVQIINQFEPTAVYDPALSQRVGWQVYHGGVGLPGFVTTMGNVTTHLGTGPHAIDVLVNHEQVHVWQSRIFGPLFQTTYVGWMVGGAVVGTGYWLIHPDQNWFSLVETAAYYDNPWEVWAYVNDHNWPPPGANPALLWQLPTIPPIRPPTIPPICWYL